LINVAKESYLLTPDFTREWRQETENIGKVFFRPITMEVDAPRLYSLKERLSESYRRFHVNKTQGTRLQLSSLAQICQPPFSNQRCLVLSQQCLKAFPP
jgi:hypothetical protein